MDKNITQLGSLLRRYLGRFLKRPEDIDEVAQESFLKMLEAESKGTIRYPKAYLFRTAKNLALNSLTKKSNRTVDYIEEMLDTDVLNGCKTLSDEIEAKENFELFCQAAAQLPPQCQRVFILRKVYGLSQREVAEHLNISVSTVEKHLAKGLIRCSQFLDEHGYGVDKPRQQRKTQ